MAPYSFEASLEGQATLDDQLFFRKDVEVCKAPKIAVSDEGPAFLKYDSRLGKIMGIIGLIVALIGLGVLYLASEIQSFTILNQAKAAIGIGILLMIIGGYQIGRRPTPMQSNSADPIGFLKYRKIRPGS